MTNRVEGPDGCMVVDIGGGALLHGLSERLSKKMTIEFHIAEDPLHSVAKGTRVALKNLDKLSFLIHGSVG